MVDEGQLEEAIELQQRSYALLKWLGEAVPRGFISFHTAHKYTSVASSARAWIEEHFDNLPPAARPPARDEATLTRFANVFSSYLETSFDLIETPGTRLKTGCGCYCSYCAIAARAPHLQPKRLASADKSRAKQLELAAVIDLAADLGSDATRDGCAALLENRRLREHAAFLAYAEQLLRRCDGVYTGPWVLALWRTFAWKAEGSPKRDFRPTAAMLEQARVALRQALHGVSP